MFKHYRTAALLSASLILAGNATAAVKHGSLILTQNNINNDDFTNAAPSVSITTLAATEGNKDYFFNANRGDIDMEFAPGFDDTAVGVFISNVRTLATDKSADGDSPAGDNYVTTFIDYSLNNASPDWDLQPYYFMPIETTGGSVLGDSREINADVAFAFFDYSEYLAGYADNRGLIRESENGTPIDVIGGATQTGITLVDDIVGAPNPDPGTNPGAEFFDSATSNGIYTLDMQSLTAPTTQTAATPSNGVLLVTGGKNEDNYALSGDNGDGTFTIFVKDNNSNGSGTEQDPVAFAYVPLDDPDTVAVGRIDGDGDTIVGSGSFTVSYDGVTQQFLLTSPGQDNTTATLIISPERDPINGGFTVDNIVSYEYSSADNGWLIETRDLTGATLQTLDPADPAFSFALFDIGNDVVQPIPGDLDGDGDVDGVDLSGFFSAFTGPNNGPVSNPLADLDNDGDVDGVDLSAAFTAFTGPIVPANVPEPTSLALLGLGGLIVARRRRG